MTDARKQRTEFGDFQTPPELARRVCALITTNGFSPGSILEPTCGKGSFIDAALNAFPNVKVARGFDINNEYVRQARKTLNGALNTVTRIQESDFFLTDWNKQISSLPCPILVVGNPPWVTNAVLGVLKSGNLPAKSNVDNLRGIDALMGKSNFDISEWMLRQYISWLEGKEGMMAVLCKTSVARKVLRTAWDTSSSISKASVYGIDAKKYFDVAVDACALIVCFTPGGNCRECSEYSSLGSKEPNRVFGLRDGRLVADVVAYDKWKHLAVDGLIGWRSGIKHDCSKVFELTLKDGVYTNGLGEQIELEQEVVFPLLKSSDLARNRLPRKWLLVPHKSMKDDVSILHRKAPKAWRYLEAHIDFLQKRGSSIYKKRHPFSIFGVGAYSFSPWKVAISGLYKELSFVKVSEFNSRPIVLDDTCYSFPCQTEDECNLLFDLLTSDLVREFLSAFIFWDTKRPITAEILNRLDLKSLGEVLSCDANKIGALAQRQVAQYAKQEGQQVLFT